MKPRSRRKQSNTASSNSNGNTGNISLQHEQDGPNRVSNGHHQTQQPTKQARKPTNEEATLTAKNYRLAKELSDLRLRHRDETKAVTRLTMENMNLASRCREAMSHVSVLKRELVASQRRCVEMERVLKNSSQENLIDDGSSLKVDVSTPRREMNNTEEPITVHHNDDLITQNTAVGKGTSPKLRDRVSPSLSVSTSGNSNVKHSERGANSPLTMGRETEDEARKDASTIVHRRPLSPVPGFRPIPAMGGEPRPSSPRKDRLSLDRPPVSPRGDRTPVSPKGDRLISSPKGSHRPSSPRRDRRPSSPRNDRQPTSPRDQQPLPLNFHRLPSSPKTKNRPSSPKERRQPISVSTGHRHPSPQSAHGHLSLIEKPFLPRNNSRSLTHLGERGARPSASTPIPPQNINEQDIFNNKKQSMSLDISLPGDDKRRRSRGDKEDDVQSLQSVKKLDSLSELSQKNIPKRQKQNQSNIEAFDASFDTTFPPQFPSNSSGSFSSRVTENSSLNIAFDVPEAFSDPFFLGTMDMSLEVDDNNNSFSMESEDGAGNNSLYFGSVNGTAAVESQTQNSLTTKAPLSKSKIAVDEPQPSELLCIQQSRSHQKQKRNLPATVMEGQDSSTIDGDSKKMIHVRNNEPNDTILSDEKSVDAMHPINKIDLDIGNASMDRTADINRKISESSVLRQTEARTPQPSEHDNDDENLHGDEVKEALHTSNTPDKRAGNKENPNEKGFSTPPNHQSSSTPNQLHMEAESPNDISDDIPASTNPSRPTKRTGTSIARARYVAATIENFSTSSDLNHRNDTESVKNNSTVVASRLKEKPKVITNNLVSTQPESEKAIGPASAPSPSSSMNHGPSLVLKRLQQRKAKGKSSAEKKLSGRGVSGTVEKDQPSGSPLERTEINGNQAELDHSQISIDVSNEDVKTDIGTKAFPVSSTAPRTNSTQNSDIIPFDKETLRAEVKSKQINSRNQIRTSSLNVSKVTEAASTPVYSANRKDDTLSTSASVDLSSVAPRARASSPSLSRRSSNNISPHTIDEEIRRLDAIATAAPQLSNQLQQASSSSVASSFPKRRVRQPISYAEPTLNSKLRRGDTFFQKPSPEEGEHNRYRPKTPSSRNASL